MLVRIKVCVNLSHVVLPLKAVGKGRSRSRELASAQEGGQKVWVSASRRGIAQSEYATLKTQPPRKLPRRCTRRSQRATRAQESEGELAH
jgi:hypothetical protein